MTMAVDHGLQYSVEVKSRFALFMDDGDGAPPSIVSAEAGGQDASKQVETVVSASRMKGPARPQKAEALPADRRGGATAGGRGARGGGPAARGGRGSSRGGGFGGRQGNDYEFATDEIARENSHRPRGRGRGGHATRGREYERHSGSDKTGVKAQVKKDGFGTGNWGTMEDEMEATMAPVTEAKEEGEAGADVAAAEEPQVEVEPEPEHFTLEQYKAMQQGKRGNAQAKPTRKPNDGQDVFKGMKAHQAAKTEKTAPQSVPKVHMPTNGADELGITFKVMNNQFGGGAGGPRGGFRGRGGGGERRGGGGGRGRGAANGGERAERGEPRERREGGGGFSRGGGAPGESRGRGGRGAAGGGPSGRGGRGGPRGGGGGGGAAASAGAGGEPHHSRQQQHHHGAPAPSLNDQDFPSLS